MLTTWLAVGVLMLTCGVAMARLLWNADGRPPLHHPATTEPRTTSDLPKGRSTQSSPT
ncbi:hypothetical protein [Iamia sp.]|uniref:hypothetical protein n=1 Tax=Iamia sp. TaxID=2722710 RepID=UPI002BAF24AF|nr:hypothetical protein [Iamia sp.]HXH59008.1 hypothetical protein [Iamia sp.]